MLPPVVEAGDAPPSASTAAARLAPEARPSAATVPGSPGRVSPFSEHEKAPLAHVLCTRAVAAGVVVSRGPMSRRHQDARASGAEFWVVVFARMFNGTDRFSPTQECAYGGWDPKFIPM